MLMTQVLADAYRCEAAIEDAEADDGRDCGRCGGGGDTVVGETTGR